MYSFLLEFYVSTYYKNRLDSAIYSLIYKLGLLYLTEFSVCAEMSFTWT